MNQSEVRAKLICIRNSSLTDDEKRKQSQAILTSGVSNNPISNRSKNCDHYDKNCSQFYFECCLMYDPCVRCHRSRDICKSKSIVSKLTCSLCDVEQPPSPSCISCGIKFSHSYCEICQIWSAKDLYHCTDCGFCRVGKLGEIWHCHNCNLCYSIESMATHKCLKIKIKDELCNICLESLYTSQQPFTILKCNHVAHQHCLNNMYHQGQYKCPICKKCVCDMSLLWASYRQEILYQPLPLNWFGVKENDTVISPYGVFQITSINEEDMCEGLLINWNLANSQTARAFLQKSTLRKAVEVYCNDCQLKCWSEFHFVGLECKYCKGFNTQA